MRISDWSSDVCSSDLVDDALDDGGCFGKRYDAGNPGEFPRISHGDGVAVLGKLKDNDADDHRTILPSSRGTKAGGDVLTACQRCDPPEKARSEEHTSELQSLMRISYAVFCLKKQRTHQNT